MAHCGLKGGNNAQVRRDLRQSLKGYQESNAQGTIKYGIYFRGNLDNGISEDIHKA